MITIVSFKWDQKKALEIAKQEAYEEGVRSVLIQVVLSLLKKKYPLTTVIDVTDLPIEEIRKIARENGLMLEVL